MADETVEALAKRHFEGMKGWGKMLYHTEHRWGDWNSLSEEEQLKYVKAVVSVMVNDSGFSRGLTLYSLLWMNQEQIFFTIAKPIRRFWSKTGDAGGKMKNEDKVILDLCGGTGAWSQPYLDKGYKIINVTLPDYDVREYVPPQDISIYGILAAPPCTMFSLARTRAKTPRNLQEGMELVIACLEVIWACQYENLLEFWALENPMGYLRWFLGRPALTFDPCDFGDPYTKKTDLWGHFNLPKINPVGLTPQEKYLCSQNNRQLPSISDFTGSKQSDRRAITPPGFAKAFYEANR